MNNIFIHLSTGNEYILLQHVHFKIPVINVWIHLVKYQSVNNTLDICYRFQSDFYNNFKIKE